MSFATDIRYALRQIRRFPGLAAVALGSIAITVGAVSVVFTAVKAVLLNPLPYAQASDLFYIRTDSSRYPASRADWVFWPDMQDLRRRSRTLESLSTYHYAIFNLTGDRNSPPEALYGAFVSAGMFSTLGVKPMLGRSVLPEEEQLGRDREMILSYGLWKRRFNSDPKVVGRSVEANGHPCMIIGVMPPGFDFPMRLATTVQVPSHHMDFVIGGLLTGSFIKLIRTNPGSAPRVIRTARPGQDPLGKRFCVSCSDDKLRQWKQVVGVVTSIRHSGLDEPISGQVYFADGAYQHAQFLVARTGRPAPELTKAIRLAIASIDPKQPVFLSATMSTLIGDSIADRRFIMTLLAITDCLALLLAAGGVYGVISYTASRRTQEIGICMALGAGPHHIRALILRQGMLLAGIGAVIGLVVALALRQFLRNRVFGIASNDPALTLSAIALVVATALVACWIPAYRAARIDPMEALRKE